MIVPFRQGIVRCLDAGFLTVGPTYVTLNVVDTPALISFAHGSVDYLFVEQQPATNAWGPITPGVDQWLFWDIDLRTGRRSFGITLVKPLHQNVPPTAPVNDQHWFDTTTVTMKVWNSAVNRWIEKIRVFACELDGGTTPVSMSANSPAFVGTQAGLSMEYPAGVILFDVATGNPLRTADNKFLTGETKLQATTGATSSIKTEALIVEAEAQDNLSAYTVVKFKDFGKIEAADQFTTSTPQQFGIIETNAVIGDIVTVTTTGVISSPTWEWTSVNALLYVDSQGQLTTTQTGTLPPVGIVIDVSKILLFSASGGTNNAGDVYPSSPTVLGGVKLSVPPVDANNPIAVGDNDPRVTNALSRTGGIMSGYLTLDMEPVSPNHAATKQYVDNIAITGANAVAKTGDTMTGFLTLPGDPVSLLHAVTKQYVDGQLLTVGITTHTKQNNGVTSLTIGMPVYSTGIGTVTRASANNATTSNILGLVADLEISVGQTGKIQSSGLMQATTGQWDAITGQVGGLTEGALYYLNVSPTGRLTTTPPSTPGQYVVSIGIAVSSTQMFINTQPSIHL